MATNKVASNYLLCCEQGQSCIFLSFSSIIITRQAFESEILVGCHCSYN